MTASSAVNDPYFLVSLSKLVLMRSAVQRWAIAIPPEFTLHLKSNPLPTSSNLEPKRQRRALWPRKGRGGQSKIAHMFEAARRMAVMAGDGPVSRLGGLSVNFGSSLVSVGVGAVEG